MVEGSYSGVPPAEIVTFLQIPFLSQPDVPRHCDVGILQGGKCKVCVSRFFPIPNWISAIEKEGKSHNYFGEPAPISNRGIAPYFHAVPLMAGRGTHAVARTPAISLQS